MGSIRRSARLADYLDLLRVLSRDNAQALVVGGQAVNLWAEIFEPDEPELRQYRPFTSADLDLHRTDTAARRILRVQAGRTERERDPFGKAFTIVSQTFFIQRSDETPLAVDELKMVAGLTPAEINKGTMTVRYSGVAIRVLSPMTCLKAKLFNLKTIAQQDRQDLKHVRILILCTRAFIRRLLVEGSKDGNYRMTFNALKQTVHFTSSAPVIRTARAHNLNLVHTVPLVELTSSHDPKLVRFVSHQLTRWQKLLA